MRMAKYSIKVANDMMVIVIDDDEEGSPSLTNSADAVIQDLNSKVGGLGSRRVYYRDSVGPLMSCATPVEYSPALQRASQASKRHSGT